MLTAFGLVVAFVGPLVAPHDPVAVNLSLRLRPPSAEHWLGTDQLGRDVLSRLLHGGRTSLIVVAIAVALSGIVGTALGMLSGYLGGRTDMVIMRLADIQLAFPTILLALTVIAVLGSSIPVLIGVFAFTGFARYIRIVRADALLLRQRGFTEAALSAGSPMTRTLRVHFLPNLIGTLVVLMNLEFSRLLLLEAALSFLGLGIQPPAPTWGNMVQDGQVYIRTAWWIVTVPGLMIGILVLGINMLGEGARSRYDRAAR